MDLTRDNTNNCFILLVNCYLEIKFHKKNQTNSFVNINAFFRLPFFKHVFQL